MLRPLILCGLLLAAGLPAAAEMYKCRGADGKILYTSDKSQCPGAQKHEPRGEVHRAAPKPESARPAATQAYGAAASLDEAEAAAWANKRKEAEAQLAQVEVRREQFRQAVTWCNRGNELYVEQKNGVRRSVSCESVREQHEQLEAENTRLREYLNGGLEEECRRAGCLPGWIR